VKILIIGLNFWPESVGVGKYTTILADFLARRGHTTRVVAGAPYYPQWRRHAGWPRFSYKRNHMVAGEAGENLADVNIIYCPHYVPNVPSSFKRLMHLLSFGITSLVPSLWQALSWRPNLVISIAPTMFSAFSALACSAACRSPAVLHIQDLEFDAAFELGMIRSDALRKIAAATESVLLRRFDIISTISESMKQRLMRKGVAPGKLVLFPNGVDISAIYPLSDTSPLRDDLKIPADRCVALYAGSIGEKQGLENIIEVAQSPQLQHVLFVICGEGPGKARLEEMARASENVMFLPLQPLERLNQLLNLADMHLLPQRAGVGDSVLPSKATGMLASGRPIVVWTEDGSVLASLLNGCGVRVRPGDISSVASAILELSLDKKRRHELGTVARKRAVEQLSIAPIHESFEELLTDTAGQ
jgi:colanic acid biosynthesis glycosyl transferase WcaI